MAALLATGLKALFLALACAFTVVACYVYHYHPIYSRDTYTTWLRTGIAEFFVNMSPFALWVVYKESSFLHSAIWLLVMFPTGSAVVCGYVFMHLLKLSPQESQQDPIYHVLLRHEHKRSYDDDEEIKGKTDKSCSVVAARIGFISLVCLMIAAVVYSIFAAGSPFRMEVLLAPWIIGTVIDSSFVTVCLLVWVFYKETSWLSASLWVVPFLFTGCFATCVYMTIKLFQLSPEDPLYLVMLRHNNKGASRRPLLSSV